VLETASSRAAALVLADANYPGWRAFVNGQGRPVENANGLFRTVEVPRGAAKIDMVFEPQCLRLGLFLTLCGLAGLSFMVQVPAKAALLENENESDTRP
jgi:uncharacterized membrane protein YfhO